MTRPRLLGSVKPFIAAIAFIITASILVAAIYFTLLDLEWIAFLAGTLFASMLAMVSRATRAEFAAADSGAKLAVGEARFAEQAAFMAKLEDALERAHQRLQFADERFPLMVAFVDTHGMFRFHNLAFRHWMDLPERHIDGHHLRDVLGRNTFAQIESAAQRALAGETVRYQRTQKMPSGAVFRVHVHLIPAQDAQGRPDGYFAVLADITERKDLQATAVAAAQIAAPQSEQAQFHASVAEHVTGHTDIRARMLAAIEHNEFALFCQSIVPLDEAAGRPQHFEVLIRLREEESNLIPPGAFLPLAEELGMLPQLDRWVVANLFGHIAAGDRARGGHGKAVYFVNVAGATLCDPDFPDYVAQQLKKFDVAGHAVCFEVVNADLVANRHDVEQFIKAVKLAGCRVALCGFGREQVSIALLKVLPLDFVKIDGSVILNVLRDPVAIGKVVTIHRVAREHGIITVAEMVEDRATEARLREASVEYAQGFGISQPHPLV